MTPATGLSRIHQISMNTHDVDRAVRFYHDTLGLPFLFAAPPRLAFFDCNGIRLMLSTPEPGFDRPGSSSISPWKHPADRDPEVTRSRIRTEPHKNGYAG